MNSNNAAVAVSRAARADVITRRHELKFYQFEIRSEKIPKGFDGYRILHLSDLHSKSYGRDGDDLVESCAELKPDAIMFTGDLFSRSENIFTIKRKVPLMKKLNALAPLYYVWGNHESDVPEKARLMNSRLAEEGITVLRNQRTRLKSCGDYINLFGLELENGCYKNPKGGYKDLTPVTAEMIDELLGKPNTEEFNLMLAHTPMPFEEYARWGADLVLAGHCHGGIIRLPGGIGLLSPERKFFPKYTKGLYTASLGERKSQMEVSTGLGKFRLNNPEMVSLCILKRM